MLVAEEEEEAAQAQEQVQVELASALEELVSVQPFQEFDLHVDSESLQVSPFVLESGRSASFRRELLRQRRGPQRRPLG